MAANTTDICASVQPYGTSGGPVNTCAYRVNATADALGATARCCGLNNDPIDYTPSMAPPNCFKVCNILNYTSDRLQDNSVTLSNCLGKALGGEVGHVFCNYKDDKKSAAASVHRRGVSWSAIGIVGILVGTPFLAL
ncbi:uncharacterized protein BP5553_04419 [Venustampulla echinocandica]|uniref:Uncharacterized protein n=1 Tax=Venustampulla echinocandica TaxID=2656787 RepID=A0A370TN83_9HELO|nr:uncharacterized protein BP5553_04419 [Venustampulla echinocandica]RDL36986.1 hypothetical protein BP5553_04419 [Venustampulla echinocandica]